MSLRGVNIMKKDMNEMLLLAIILLVLSGLSLLGTVLDVEAHQNNGDESLVTMMAGK